MLAPSVQGYGSELDRLARQLEDPAKENFTGMQDESLAVQRCAEE